jgi:hypothetical protein
MHDANPTSDRARGAGFQRFVGAGVLLLVASVVGANILSNKLEKGELPIIAIIRSDQGLNRLAKSAPVGRTGKVETQIGAAVTRGAGIDRAATAAIPRAGGGAAVSPCGPKSQSVMVVRSVGVEGVITAPIPPVGLAGYSLCGDGGK